MPNTPDPPDWAAAALKEVRAATAAGRQLSRDDFLELFLRHARGAYPAVPTVAAIKASIAPYEKDLDRVLAEAAAVFPDGMRNPAFRDELEKRVMALMVSRLGNAGGASA